MSITGLDAAQARRIRAVVIMRWRRVEESALSMAGWYCQSGWTSETVRDTGNPFEAGRKAWKALILLARSRARSPVFCLFPGLQWGNVFHQEVAGDATDSLKSIDSYRLHPGRRTGSELHDEYNRTQGEPGVGRETGA